MSKSVLYAGNSTAQPFVATGTIVSFPNIVRRYGTDIGISGGNVVITSGYYELNANLTFVPTEVGTATVTIYKDGVAIPYANQSLSVATGDSYPFSVEAIARQKCCCESTITVVISGVAGSVTNSAITVERQ